MGCLALVILCDQLSRNMFRDNAGAFSTDDLALRVVQDAMGKGFDAQLPPLALNIFYMPLMHSESLEIHEQLSLPKFTAIGSSFYAEKHANIIRKFGRFVHNTHPLPACLLADKLTHFPGHQLTNQAYPLSLPDIPTATQC